MTKAEQTRQFIIETTAPIFNKKGYENTSLSDVQEVTKLTKGAIYGNFSDKNELAVAAFQHNCIVAARRIKAAMESATSAKEALKSLAVMYAQNWNSVLERGGCPMLNASVEADDHLVFLRAEVRKTIKQFVKNLRILIEQGQANNEFDKKASASDIADSIFMIWEGGVLYSKIMNDAKYLSIAAERMNAIIDNELSK
ncbi:TetR family transcriptional regulator [Arachidicoccus ginsenosidimutans]|uniref:TetR/AcrR family transcriptional regulator n=1 Tax=Arachidicoccus sp. BS20 TaxID=1850526 RepID=UPI0007F0A2B7|nr:TetR/AcrR family transcriptional regulator [Arachidicoccus sp. BS20]ANI88151.1 TetR family transcriptional regulator [Arachidicoccus sp. BS20]